MAKKIYAKARFGLREDTYENWMVNNPVLEKGEPAVVRDGTGAEWLKIGDGVTAFKALPWKKGPKGDTGFAAVIREKSKTENEYILEIINEHGTTVTPNLKSGTVGIRDTGGEIFNDYETNRAISAYSAAKGSENIAGSKAFYITALDEACLTFTLDGDISELAVGDVYSCQLGNNYEAVGKITELNTETNTVTVDTFPSGYTWSETSTFRIPKKPLVGTQTIGNYAYSEGGLNVASNVSSHAEGYQNIASGKYSHAEGRKTYAGYAAHAEGYSTQALGNASHAEGQETAATGPYSHAEGHKTAAAGYRSHAEGFATKAGGGAAHAEGSSTEASGDNSHTEGQNTLAAGIACHAEGSGTKAKNHTSHAEGENTEAAGYGAHAEGRENVASGMAAHSEGFKTNAQGNYSHAEGNGAQATGSTSHAEGSGKAEGSGSHAEGSGTAKGERSHAEGSSTAEGNASHAEGGTTVSSGGCAHAEGENTEAVGYAAHSEGQKTVAGGDQSHAEGYYTSALHKGSHSSGAYTETGRNYQTVVGAHNKVSTDTYFVVGNGSSDDKKNAFEVKTDGSARLQKSAVTDDAVVRYEQIKNILSDAKDYTDRELAEFDFIKIVQTLPETGLPNRMYLVPSATTTEQDLFDEYIWVNKGTEESAEWVWEFVASKKVEVDLTEYVNKEELSEELENVNGSISGINGYVENINDRVSGLSTDLESVTITVNGLCDTCATIGDNAQQALSRVEEIEEDYLILNTITTDSSGVRWCIRQWNSGFIEMDGCKPQYSFDSLAQSGDASIYFGSCGGFTFPVTLTELFSVTPSFMSTKSNAWCGLQGVSESGIENFFATRGTNAAIAGKPSISVKGLWK